MLDEHKIAYRYREYRSDPLSVRELRALMKRLGVKPQQVLRRNDRAFRELGLGGDEPAGRLIELMAQHPTLLQRPIGVVGERAVVGRPPERLLELS